MEFVCDLLETVIASISFFMLKKYIFLEKDLPHFLPFVYSGIAVRRL